MKLGWMLQSLIGTTVCESLTCAANIFLGMSESPLLIKPYIKVIFFTVAVADFLVLQSFSVRPTKQSFLLIGQKLYKI